MRGMKDEPDISPEYWEKIERSWQSSFTLLI